ncbi:MAG: NADH:flavin oxidoreductase, partial [Bacteroidota bacterium]
LVSEDLIKYHRSVAAGGVAMTTVAYAAVSQSGLSFDHQLWIRKEAMSGLRALTDAIHQQGALAAVQIGHCGLMAKKTVSGGKCLAPGSGFNLYGLTFPRKATRQEILNIVHDFGVATKLARESGFDAVEVHAGHGYLISQFISSYTNKRKDEYGGAFENRTRFMREVILEVLESAGTSLAVVVKMNLRDGFSGGSEMEEARGVAKMLEAAGVHGLVLSGGFVAKAPMYVMRGSMPVGVMAHYMKSPWMKLGTSLFGSFLMKPEPFKEAYFLEDALKIRSTVKIPLIFVGGMSTREGIQRVLEKEFEFVQFARALIHDPSFINKLKSGEISISGCQHTNYCIARMYSGKMLCIQHEQHLPEKWRKKLNG